MQSTLPRGPGPPRMLSSRRPWRPGQMRRLCRRTLTRNNLELGRIPKQNHLTHLIMKPTAGGTGLIPHRFGFLSTAGSDRISSCQPTLVLPSAGTTGSNTPGKGAGQVRANCGALPPAPPPRRRRLGKAAAGPRARALTRRRGRGCVSRPGAPGLLQGGGNQLAADSSAHGHVGPRATAHLRPSLLSEKPNASDRRAGFKYSRQ